jgi:hypothetical protein
MARRIQSLAFEGTQGQGVDTYFDRIVKYIPADIVSAWVAVTGIIKASSGIPTITVYWVTFLIGIGITLVWTLRQTNVPGARPAWLQAAISSVAFIVWVFALGEPFASLSFYNPVYGSLALIGFTLISGIIIPDK